MNQLFSRAKSVNALGDANELALLPFFQVFDGNTDPDTIVSHKLSPPIRARYIRFLPTAWHKHISMRVELYGCKGKGFSSK